MSIDVVDLRNFCGQRLGVVARRFVGRGIRSLWNDTAGQRVLGIGYATPYLGLFREEAERCLAFMPAGQGVVKWPTTRPALSALVDENELPLPDSAVDRVILVHALEMTNDPAALLREVWRVLATAAEAIRVITALVYPILPDSAAKVWRQLGQGEISEAAIKSFLVNLAWSGLRAGTKFGEPAPLFPRAEKDAVERMQNIEDENNKSVIEAAGGQEQAAKSGPEAPASALGVSPVPAPPEPTVAPAPGAPSAVPPTLRAADAGAHPPPAAATT